MIVENYCRLFAEGLAAVLMVVAVSSMTCLPVDVGNHYILFPAL